MKVKKVLRYYTDCGKGFWSKQKALTHEENCKCWKNPKFKACLSCVSKDIYKDSDDTGNTWYANRCEFSNLGVPAHKDHDYIRKECPKHLALNK